jgi:hypothetical protein
LFPLFVILVLAAGFYLYQMPDQPWGPYLERLQNLLSDRDGEKDPVISSEPTAGPAVPGSASTNKVEPAKSQPAVVSPVQLDVSIGLGFRPVGFNIAAVSQAITLSQEPGKRLRHLPGFASPRQWYGVIKLAHGQEYRFALDLGGEGHRMFIDHNRNGDLRDDGEPLVNQGKGLFASRWLLPLAKVTGIPKLTGDYQLWIYTNPASWGNEQILYYSMTQLRGELLLKGERYTAFLADNGPVDGDYRNDGISIDLNGDGKIERESEFFPKGQDALIDGVSYRFTVTR